MTPPPPSCAMRAINPGLEPCESPTIPNHMRSMLWDRGSLGYWTAFDTLSETLESPNCIEHSRVRYEKVHYLPSAYIVVAKATGCKARCNLTDNGIQGTKPMELFQDRKGTAVPFYETRSCRRWKFDNKTYDIHTEKA